MKTKLISLFVAIVLSVSVQGEQSDTTKTKDKELKTSYLIEILEVSQDYNLVDNGKVEMSSAFSADDGKENNELFGSFWAESEFNKSKNGTQNWVVKDVRLTVELEEDDMNLLKQSLQKELTANYTSLNTQDINDLVKEKAEHATNNLNNEAPQIIYTNQPSALVIIDGEPHFETLDKRYLKVVNANAFIIQDTKEKLFFMYGSGLWFASRDVLSGWNYIDYAPNRIKRVMRKHARDLHKSMTNMEYQAMVVPEIIVSTEPAEIISTDGNPKHVIIANTNLSFVENTDAELFKHIQSNRFYTLFSGRWFTSNKLEGNWEYISSNDLPAGFANIPEDHEKSSVLVSVAGTEAAENALKDAQVPYVQKKDIATTINKDMEYNGEPKFEKIEGTELSYAVNTSNSVLKWNNSYYLVDEGVWYISNSPVGTWNIATERPDGVENIPADNPLFNLKYVYVYKKTPDVVYTGFTSGYTGSYIHGPTVVFGTGFYYHRWYGHHYYHYPMTYGYGFYYDPFYGWVPVYSPYYRPSFYWHWHRHYWYGYRPPYYRPPHHHPPRIEHYNAGKRPTNPNVRPEQPIHRPGQPAVLPSQPMNRPSQPAARPSQPAARPAQRR